MYCISYTYVSSWIVILIQWQNSMLFNHFKNSNNAPKISRHFFVFLSVVTGDLLRLMQQFTVLRECLNLQLFTQNIYKENIRSVLLSSRWRKFTVKTRKTAERHKCGCSTETAPSRRPNTRQAVENVNSSRSWMLVISFPQSWALLWSHFSHLNDATHSCEVHNENTQHCESSRLL